MTVLVAIGTRKGMWLARSEDRRSWSVEGPHFLLTEVPAVAIDTRRGGARVLAGVRSEWWGPTVSWSDDEGKSWQETEKGGMRFPDTAGASVERVWQLQPDSAERPEVVWAGAEPHSLWRSEDAGQTFSLVDGLWDHPHRTEWGPGYGGAAIHTVVPDPHSDRVAVAMSTGGVYVSDDRGGSWRPSNKGISAGFLPGEEPEYGQCVHKIAPAAGGPQRMYAQNHGGVYRSDNAGATWTSIAEGLPSDFGFPVLAHPRDPDTAWVVPLEAQHRVPPEGRLRLHRTRDAGATWTAVGQGLPDDYWVSVLRDAACVDDADPVGVYVGTRDGCVYASADEGDSFVPVVDHLPDVLSVRAAVVA
jgi:hypothetical protein